MTGGHVSKRKARKLEEAEANKNKRTVPFRRKYLTAVAKRKRREEQNNDGN